MTIHRIRLRPRSPWRTPWQADTLTGALCATAARVYGDDFLIERLIKPMLAGQPPFILSDACPGDLLPIPAWLRLAEWPDGCDRKYMKRARWLHTEAFRMARTGKLPPFEMLVSDEKVFFEYARQHNTLDRLTNTTGDAKMGLGPFSRPETSLLSDPANQQADGILTVYFRVCDDASDRHDLFLDLMHELSLTGFGADVATGRGQFDIVSDPDAVHELETPTKNANALICLSTFQPAPHDPVNGLWEIFPKFAKLGPDLGVSDVRKNTLIMFRPGACFHSDVPHQFLGRAVPMRELLPSKTAGELLCRNLNIIHPAFGLTVSARIDLSSMQLL
ncbi:MAG TPA: hypothetical protein PK400_00765 [Phycisphaerales bacterium]|nr:hypothetical protein [Phycisphaerales bacterium]HRQ74547.1 hypothetical protein [Phycisphaerales bacterium]